MLADAGRARRRDDRGRATPRARRHGQGLDRRRGFPCAGTSPSHHDRRPDRGRDRRRPTACRGRGGAGQDQGVGRHDGRTTRGPPAATRTDRPGGSSSGEGVVTAAGVSALGVGSDSGGSVRLPAAWCGVVRPQADDRTRPDHGPLPARRTDERRPHPDRLPRQPTSRRSRRALGVVAGPDGRDAGVAPVRRTRPTRRRAGAVRGAPGRSRVPGRPRGHGRGHRAAVPARRDGHGGTGVDVGVARRGARRDAALLGPHEAVGRSTSRASSGTGTGSGAASSRTWTTSTCC